MPSRDKNVRFPYLSVKAITKESNVSWVMSVSPLYWGDTLILYYLFIFILFLNII
jgi:hypothetical protein